MDAPIVTLDAGPHDRHSCPLALPIPEGVSRGVWELIDQDGSLRIPLQACEDGLARFVIPAMTAGEQRAFKINACNPSAARQRAAMADSGEALDILLDGELAARYVYADVPARPYFYPVFAPGQIPISRAYPMASGVPGETQDHPHHRSLWIAFGDVNGADNWSEEVGHASTRHNRFLEVSGGPVTGVFASISEWVTSDGRMLLTQRLRVRSWVTDSESRLLDFEIGLEATGGDVHFGDTKEGGILSVRVASDLDVPRTGRITNAYGGIDEGETWGQPAHWCDYSGLVNGSATGIAVFDHPDSFRYPTHWHVRNYGLMTANPFGYAAYTGGLKNGSHTLPGGETLSFKYRIVLHAGDCSAARIRARYLDFVAPPSVQLEAKR